MTYLLLVLVGGLVIGAIARLIVPGRQNMGCIATSLCGVGGSLIGGLIGRLLFGSSYAPGVIMSVLGATLLIWFLYGSRRRW